VLNIERSAEKAFIDFNIDGLIHVLWAVLSGYRGEFVLSKEHIKSQALQERTLRPFAQPIQYDEVTDRIVIKDMTYNEATSFISVLNSLNSTLMNSNIMLPIYPKKIHALYRGGKRNSFEYDKDQLKPLMIAISQNEKNLNLVEQMEKFASVQYYLWYGFGVYASLEVNSRGQLQLQSDLIIWVPHYSSSEKRMFELVQEAQVDPLSSGFGISRMLTLNFAECKKIYATSQYDIEEIRSAFYIERANENEAIEHSWRESEVALRLIEKYEAALLLKDKSKMLQGIKKDSLAHAPAFVTYMQRQKTSLRNRFENKKQELPSLPEKVNTEYKFKMD
jgi:hypothetical protein